MDSPIYPLHTAPGIVCPTSLPPDLRVTHFPSGPMEPSRDFYREGFTPKEQDSVVAGVAIDRIAIHHELVAQDGFSSHCHFHHGTASKDTHVEKITLFYKRKLHTAIIPRRSVSVRKITREKFLAEGRLFQRNALTFWVLKSMDTFWCTKNRTLRHTQIRM